MNLRIPRANSDISETINKKYRKLAVICLLWASAVCICEYLWLFDYFSVRINTLTAVVVWVIVTLIPFIVMNGPEMLFDRSWRGEIIEVKYTNSISQRTKGRRLLLSGVTELTVRCDNGKIAFITMPRPKMDSHSCYDVGDKVCYLKGTQYPFFTGSYKKGKQVCPLCGSLNELSKAECFYCNHSVIDPKAM